MGNGRASVWGQRCTGYIPRDRTRNGGPLVVSLLLTPYESMTGSGALGEERYGCSLVTKRNNSQQQTTRQAGKRVYGVTLRASIDRNSDVGELAGVAEDWSCSQW